MPRERILFVIAAALLWGCGASAPPPRTGGTSGAGEPAASQPAKKRIVGQLERESPQKKRLRIWGHVQRIIENKHGQLPSLSKTSSGGVGDPVTEIINETSFTLTIWFAGKCAHQSQVAPHGKLIAAFCPGTYNLAAVVDNKEYLPLVRENQQFEGGMGYKLQILIKQRPKTTPPDSSR